LEELAEWLKSQHKGLRTYKTFHRKALEVGAKSKTDYALYSLLATLVDRFIEAYDERPLTLDVTEEAHKRLISITDEAMHFTKMAPDKQIAFLNKIAASDLA
jgi:hypothetical protein